MVLFWKNVTLPFSVSSVATSVCPKGPKQNEERSKRRKYIHAVMKRRDKCRIASNKLKVS
jgi:hypothetical protein